LEIVAPAPDLERQEESVLPDLEDIGSGKQVVSE